MAEPQVCNTAVKPMSAPRCLGSRARVRKVSAVTSEEQIVEDGAVVKGDRRNGGRQSKDQVEIRRPVTERLVARRSQRLAALRLALGAVAVAAGVVGDLHVLAGVAAQDMPAEGGRATPLNGAARLELLQAQAARAPQRLAVVAEDVRDLDAGHDALEVQILERSLDLAQQVRGDVAVAHGVGDLLVTQQHLNDPDIFVALEQVSGEGMA